MDDSVVDEEFEAKTWAACQELELPSSWAESVIANMRELEKTARELNKLREERDNG